MEGDEQRRRWLVTNGFGGGAALSGGNSGGVFDNSFKQKKNSWTNYTVCFIYNKK